MATPLTPAGCDLRDFPHTPLFRSRLFGSSFHARATDSEWRAGVTLWLKSWDQVPAGSLPEDDIELCRLAELAKDVKAWRKVRAGALRGWIACDDGRLYHAVVAEGVNTAIEAKAAQRAKTAKARIAALEKHLAKAVKDSDVEGISRLTDELKKLHQAVSLTQKVVPTESVTGSVTDSDTESKRREVEGKEKEKGEGTTYSVPVGTGAAGAEPARKPKATDPVEIIFGYGVPMLTAAGSSDKHARSFLGGLRKTHGDEAVIDKLRECLKAKPLQPLEWLGAALPPPSSQTAGERSEDAIRAENARTTAEAKRALFGAKTPETFDA